MYRQALGAASSRVNPWIGAQVVSTFPSPGNALLFAVRGPKLCKPRDLIKNWKLKVGDQVAVLSGKDKGKFGKILATDWRRNMVKVDEIFQLDEQNVRTKFSVTSGEPFQKLMFDCFHTYNFILNRDLI